LLLETGLLADLFCALAIVAALKDEPPPSRISLWLLRLLMFRLMLESGCVKLLSGDPLWRGLTALTVHYQTQPLPTWIGWWAHQLPLAVQKACCGAVFFVELVVPFFLFCPGDCGRGAAG